MPGHEGAGWFVIGLAADVKILEEISQIEPRHTRYRGWQKEKNGYRLNSNRMSAGIFSRPKYRRSAS